jgi:hypothetical protein
VNWETLVPFISDSGVRKAFKLSDDVLLAIAISSNNADG